MSDNPAANRFETVTLSAPIVRGETTIEKLNLRKPKAGELRGLNLQEVLTSDVAALLKLIPRVTEPPLTPSEAENLEPEDLAEIGGTLRGFFMTKAERQVVETLIAEHQPRT
jgi:hypothetical protein